jgi:hypothetical protein
MEAALKNVFARLPIFFAAGQKLEHGDNKPAAIEDALPARPSSRAHDHPATRANILVNHVRLSPPPQRHS